MTHYLWCDLETTGLDPELDSLCEVAVILTGDGPGFDEVARAAWVVAEHPEAAKRIAGAPFVAQMHERSGLRAAMAARNDTHTVAAIDAALNRFLSAHLGTKHRGEVHLAGSGVSHFDLRRVLAWLPQSAAWLHWRPLDVGQLEEWRRLAKMATFDEAWPEQAVRKTHRAADDIAYHLDEARWYLAGGLA